MKKLWVYLKGKKRIIGITVYAVGELLPLYPPLVPVSLPIKLLGAVIAGIGIGDVITTHIKSRKGK